MNKLWGAVLAGVVTIGLAVPGAARAEDVLAARQEGFKAAKAAMTAIKDILDAGPLVGAALPHAEKLHEVALAVPGWFPPGSDLGETKAKPNVWSDPEEFAASSVRFEAASKMLLSAAQAGNAVGVLTSFGDVRATCKSCHDSYRAD